MKHISYWLRDEHGDWKLHYEEGDKFPEGKVVADFAIWDKALTQEQIECLARGARPHQVAPESLQEWHPLDSL